MALQYIRALGEDLSRAGKVAVVRRLVNGCGFGIGKAFVIAGRGGIAREDFLHFGRHGKRRAYGFVIGVGDGGEGGGECGQDKAFHRFFPLLCGTCRMVAFFFWTLACGSFSFLLAYV